MFRRLLSPTVVGRRRDVAFTLGHCRTSPELAGVSNAISVVLGYLNMVCSKILKC